MLNNNSRCGEKFKGCRRCTVYRQLVESVGNDPGVVYELMADAEELCEVIRRDLYENPAGARRHGYWSYQPESPPPRTVVAEEIQATYDDGRLVVWPGDAVTCAGESLGTLSREGQTTTNDEGEGRAAIVVIPPSLDDGETSSLRSSVIAVKVKDLNTDYDAQVAWQRRHYY